VNSFQWRVANKASTVHLLDFVAGASLIPIWLLHLNSQNRFKRYPSLEVVAQIKCFITKKRRVALELLNHTIDKSQLPY
jgi:hypothetical protein